MTDPSGRGDLRVGISSCLLGNRVRFDGGHKLDRSLRDTLGPLVTWVPVCPEVEYGLPVPRETLRLVGTAADARIVGERTGVDHTPGFRAWTERRLAALSHEGLCGFVFKCRSPSCGVGTVAIHPPGGGAAAPGGSGLFARAFAERYPLVPVEDDERLAVPDVRARFTARVLAFAERTGRRRTPLRTP